MNKTITLGDKTFSPMSLDVQTTVAYVANELNCTYTDHEGVDRGVKPILLVVLNGAVPFAMDLIKRLHFDFDLDFVKVDSYGGNLQSSGSHTIPVWPLLPFKGREVILIEDIVDTGYTVSLLARHLMANEATAVRTATLLFKPEAYKGANPPQYIGASIENKFVVGYGMDYKGLGRGLPDIYQLVE